MPADRAPTPRQAEILDYIANHGDRVGFPPSIREIGRRFGIASTNGVNCLLRALERKGLITRGKQRARTLVVTPAGRKALAPVPALMSGSEVAEVA